MAEKKSLLQKYTEAVRSQRIRPFTSASRQWFLDMLMGGELQGGRFPLRDAAVRNRSRITLGKMYCFVYDPKHKKTLPYYDRFPLIIAADRPERGKGFFGMNLHYLRPVDRAVFFDQLMNAYSRTGTKLNESTRLQISYGILKSASRMRAYAPTFKRYLPSHIRSVIVEIPPKHWETSIYLPTHDFKKASSSRIWSDSRSML